MGELFRKEFTLSLDDPDSIQKAIDAINRIAEGLPKAMDALCNKLVKKGVVIAKKNLQSLCKTPSGALYDSIRFELSDGGKGIAYVVAGYPGDHLSENPQYARISYAVFVEYGYGTGSYYAKGSNMLLATEENIEKHRDARSINDEKTQGRTEAHPSGRNVYRRVEDYNVIHKGDGTKAFGWKYMDRKTGEWHTSFGQNPKPFMYNTLMELFDIAEREGSGTLGLYLAGSL